MYGAGSQCKDTTFVRKARQSGAIFTADRRLNALDDLGQPTGKAVGVGMAKSLEASQGRRGGGVLVVVDLRALRLFAELCRGEVAEGTARAAQALHVGIEELLAVVVGEDGPQYAGSAFVPFRPPSGQQQDQQVFVEEARFLLAALLLCQSDDLQDRLVLTLAYGVVEGGDAGGKLRPHLFLVPRLGVGLEVLEDLLGLEERRDDLQALVGLGDPDEHGQRVLERSVPHLGQFAHEGFGPGDGLAEQLLRIGRLGILFGQSGVVAVAVVGEFAKEEVAAVAGDALAVDSVQDTVGLLHLLLPAHGVIIFDRYGLALLVEAELAYGEEDLASRSLQVGDEQILLVAPVDSFGLAHPLGVGADGAGRLLAEAEGRRLLHSLPGLVLALHQSLRGCDIDLVALPLAAPHERHLAVEATDEDGRQVDGEVLDVAIESVDDVSLPDLAHQAETCDLLLQMVESLEILV